MANQDRVGRLFQQISGNQKAYRVMDDQLYFVDPADTTKRVRFDAGGVTTATERVISAPDYDVALGSGVGGRRNVLSGEANLALTAAISGSLILMDDATQAFTLPALDATNIGIWFELVSTVAATTTTVTAQAADLLTGAARISSTTAGGDDSFVPDVTDDLILTMNGTTQGGMIGSRILLTAISATRWLVNYEGVGSGTLVTPFS